MELGDSALRYNIYRSYTEGGGGIGVNAQVAYSGRMEMRGLTGRCAA